MYKEFNLTAIAKCNCELAGEKIYTGQEIDVTRITNDVDTIFVTGIKGTDVSIDIHEFYKYFRLKVNQKAN